jgi:hypothetical protein
MSRIFGPIRQNGYVVKDLHAAMDHWINVLGVGPFYYVDGILPITDFRYRGRPGVLEMTVALANSGDLQIELIQPLGSHPSLYHDFLASGQEGLQHVSVWTTDFETELARLTALGYRVVQEGRAPVENRFVYFDTEQSHRSTVMEMYDVSGIASEMFRMVREAAIGWDGTDPKRRL